jgi:predicted AlkP superfamily pyrophosphatase or phosphodiesterase
MFTQIFLTQKTGGKLKTNKKKISELIPVLFIFFLTISCTTSSFSGKQITLNLNFVPAEHLVFIGFDGWGAYYVNKANMPTIKRMISGGSLSTELRSVLPSNSLPNWTSLFMGTPPEKRFGNDFPSIFSVIKNAGNDIRENYKTETVLFYEWEELHDIFSDDAIIKFRINSDYKSAHQIAAYILENKPFFTAIIFDEPDAAGHSKGWGSKDYYDKLALLDDFASIIEQAVKDAGIYDNTVFVVSADHGGSFKGHGSRISTHRKIPLVVYGKGIKENYIIPFPADIYDITPSMAVILGLEIPSIWTGKPLYEIFN